MAPSPPGPEDQVAVRVVATVVEVAVSVSGTIAEEPGTWPFMFKGRNHK